MRFAFEPAEAKDSATGRERFLRRSQAAPSSPPRRNFFYSSVLDPMLTWIAISAVNAAVHSMSQVPRELQQWDFVRVLVRDILDNLLHPRESDVSPKRMKPWS